MEFRELTDEQWRYVEPLLPPLAKTGRPRADDRRIMNGILYVLTAGCRWMDMPMKYGSYKTVWRRLRRWEEEGVWRKMMNALIAKGYAIGMISLNIIAVDSTTVEAKKGGSW
ncbi:MAG: IS5 family transposase [archaeon]|nr:IS5 family transposase [archaeon]MCP8321342.1 IS5 family transposase [archaeon]